jgi:hypothetical protein
VTVGVLLRIVWRRGLIVAAGVALTAFACLSLPDGERTYWAKTDLMFVQPGTGPVATVPDNILPTLINYAGVVQQVGHDDKPVELVSSTAPLYRSGLREGYAVTLPNTGTQWAVSYSRPVLVVQAIGNSPDQVRQTLGRVLNEIQSAAYELQADRGAPVEQFIDVAHYPSSPEVVDVGSTKPGRIKGILALFAVGLALTAFIAVEVDRLILRRSPSRNKRGVAQ